MLRFERNNAQQTLGFCGKRRGGRVMPIKDAIFLQFKAILLLYMIPICNRCAKLLNIVNFGGKLKKKITNKNQKKIL